MNTYKITRGGWVTYQTFNTIEEAQAWAFEKWGDEAVVTLSTDYIITPPTPEEKFQFDKDFGKQLIDTFLIDNRLITPIITPAESLQLLNQFQSIEKLASLGDIKSVQVLLNQIVVDDRLFTQERKDKYMGMINSYLG